MYKALKRERRTRKREAELAADRAVTEATATGSPMRIDDETQGIALVSTVQGAFAGELINPRGCYICKNDYTLVDAFYHWLCPSCAAFSRQARPACGPHRQARCSPVAGPRSACTSRCACFATARTRRSRRGSRRMRCAASPRSTDSADWIHRLKIVGIDLRDPTQVVSLADEVAAAGPLDILINNAAQTVRRSPGAYSQLVELESAPARRRGPPGDGHLRPDQRRPPGGHRRHAAAARGRAPRGRPSRRSQRDLGTVEIEAARSAAMTALALSAGNASLGGAPGRDRGRRRRPAARPADRELLDPEGRGGRSPRAARGPALQRDRPVHPDLAAAPGDARRGAREARRAYVVNVSAMEGQFSRTYKGPATRTRTWPRPRSTC